MQTFWLPKQLWHQRKIIKTVLIGEDTDLLVLLCYHFDLRGKDILFKSETISIAKKKAWDLKKTKFVLGQDLCKALPFVQAFYQVKQWIGEDTLNFRDWGWAVENGECVPVRCSLTLAPEELLKTIYCKCKTARDTRRCPCKKTRIGMFCCLCWMPWFHLLQLIQRHYELEDEEEDADEQSQEWTIFVLLRSV